MEHLVYVQETDLVVYCNISKLGYYFSMPNRVLPFELGEDIDERFSSPEVASYAARPHAINFLDTEYTWQMLEEARRVHEHLYGEKTSASEIARNALIKYLNSQPPEVIEHLTQVAVATIELDYQTEQSRQALRSEM